jgi:hypothetical protein
VTPVPSSIAQPLAEGLAIPVVCRDAGILDLVPLKRTPVRKAIRTALDKILTHQVDTCWYDAGALLPPAWGACGDAAWAGGTVMTCGYRVRIKPERFTPRLAGSCVLPWRLHSRISAEVADHAVLGNEGARIFGRRFRQVTRYSDAGVVLRVVDKGSSIDPYFHPVLGGS